MDYDSWLTTGISKLKLHDEQCSASPNSAFTAASPFKLQEEPRSSQSGDQLPNIRLVNFDGLLRNWQPFWDQFEEVVHQKNELSQGDKFNYLKSGTTRKAAATITGLSAMFSCYANAIDILKRTPKVQTC